MDDNIKCLRCGGNNLTPSDLQSTGKIYSRPQDAKLVTVLTTGVPVSAMMCLDCGHIELLVDEKKANSLTKTA